MKILANIKRILPFILLASFFMPLTQCTRYPDKSCVDQTPTVTVNYAYNNKKLYTLETLASIASFCWPIIFLLITFFYSSLNSKSLFKVLELILCCASAYMWVLLVIFGELLIGGYLAAGAILSYFFITLFELFLLLRSKYLYKKHNNTLKRTNNP